MTCRTGTCAGDATGLRRYAGLALDGIGLLWTLVRERRRGPCGAGRDDTILGRGDLRAVVGAVGLWRAARRHRGPVRLPLLQPVRCHALLLRRAAGAAQNSRRHAISADRSSAARSGGIIGSAAPQRRPATTTYRPSSVRSVISPG